MTLEEECRLLKVQIEELRFRLTNLKSAVEFYETFEKHSDHPIVQARLAIVSMEVERALAANATVGKRVFRNI